MEVKHDASRQEFYVELEGHRAHVAYQIHDEGLDIRHTGSHWRKRYCFCFGEGGLRLRALQRTEGDSYLLLCRGLATAAS